MRWLRPCRSVHTLTFGIRKLPEVCPGLLQAGKVCSRYKTHASTPDGPQSSGCNVHRRQRLKMKCNYLYGYFFYLNLVIILIPLVRKGYFARLRRNFAGILGCPLRAIQKKIFPSPSALFLYHVRYLGCNPYYILVSNSTNPTKFAKRSRKSVLIICEDIPFRVFSHISWVLVTLKFLIVKEPITDVIKIEAKKTGTINEKTFYRR